MRSARGPTSVLELILCVDGMTTDMRILCAGEEELMRVRYVSPFAVSRSNGWDSDRWLVLLCLFGCFLFGCLWLFGWFLFVCWLGGLCFCYVVYPIYSRLRTKDVKPPFCLSE